VAVEVKIVVDVALYESDKSARVDGRGRANDMAKLTCIKRDGGDFRGLLNDRTRDCIRVLRERCGACFEDSLRRRG